MAGQGQEPALCQAQGPRGREVGASAGLGMCRFGDELRDVWELEPMGKKLVIPWVSLSCPAVGMAGAHTGGTRLIKEGAPSLGSRPCSLGAAPKDAAFEPLWSL